MAPNSSMKMKSPKTNRVKNRIRNKIHNLSKYPYNCKHNPQNIWILHNLLRKLQR